MHTSLRERSRPPAPPWAAVELAVALIISAVGLAEYLPLDATPWLFAAGTAFLWWRGPGWGGVGLRRPSHPASAVAIGIAVGVAYQFFGTYVVEPLIARATSGELPDVSQFRTVVGNEVVLAIWLAIAWTLAAFLEEMVYRGWLMTRIAELGFFSRGAWVVSLLVSSALFGAAHLYQGTSGVVSTGVTGLLFGSLYLATGRNLWAAILAHGFFDTAGFVMIYLGVYPGL